MRPQQTSWGASTRLIGGIIMTHGDSWRLRDLSPMHDVQYPAKTWVALLAEEESSSHTWQIMHCLRACVIML